MQPNFAILLDAGSYSYYRVTATMAWYRHQKDVPHPSMQNEMFLEKLRGQYLSCLEKFQKTLKKELGLLISPKDIYFIRDSPRESLWRHIHYHGYKANRDEREAKEQNKLTKLEGDDLLKAIGKQPGQYIKYLNETMGPRFKQVIRVHGAEADDSVAILTRFFLDLGINHVIVVSIDTDFYQLLDDPRVKIYNPKTWKRVECLNPRETLKQKIIAGDASDCVRKVTAPYPSENYWTQWIANSQMIDFDYIPLYLRHQIVSSLERPVSIKWQYIPVRPVTKIELGEIVHSQSHTLNLIINTLIGLNLPNLVILPQYLSSCMIPSLENFQPYLEQIGCLARRAGHRLIFLNETIPDTQTLIAQAEILDRMSTTNDSVIAIPSLSYVSLPERVSKRLAIINNDITQSEGNCGFYNITDCQNINKTTIEFILNIWQKKGTSPLFMLDNDTMLDQLVPIIKEFGITVYLLSGTQDKYSQIAINPSKTHIPMKPELFDIIDDEIIEDDIIEDEIIE